MSYSRRDFVAAVAAAGMSASIAATAEDKGSACASDNAQAVYVVAVITVKPGVRDAYVEIFKKNVPNVLAEDGCIFYDPVVDMDSGIPAQDALRPDVMVVMEKWATLKHLLAHLDAPHMATYREAVKDMVLKVDLQVMKYA